MLKIDFLLNYKKEIILREANKKIDKLNDSLEHKFGLLNLISGGDSYSVADAYLKYRYRLFLNREKRV